MALNVPDCEGYELDEIVRDNVENLVADLKKMGYKLEYDDVRYQFLDREESLGVSSELLYPGEDLPGKFGIYRGYAGGGMHSGTIKTEIFRMTKRRQAKAQRALDVFEKYFWQVLHDIDAASAENTGEEVQEWDKVSI